MHQAFDRVPKPLVFAVVVAAAALIPLLTSHSDNDDYYLRVGTVALVFALLALGLNVAVGFAGLLDLGYIAYYGVGAYGYAMLSSDKFGLHWQAWQSIIVVVGVSALLGFLLALPSRRLVGDYLAIVTLFFGQIFYVFVTQGYRVSLFGLNKDLGLDRANWDLTGGPNGIADIDRFRAFGFTASSERAYFYVTLTAVVVVFAALSLVNRSRTGRAWRALHDDSLAAQAMSVPINKLKVMAVGLGAAVAALAGTINAALLQGALSRDYNTQVLIIIYAMVILGGAGSLVGAIVGAFVVEVLLLEGLRPQTPISDWTFNGRWVFYGGILLILFVSIRPWRRLAAILGGVVAFGVVVHAIVAATTTRGTDGLLNLRPQDFGTVAARLADPALARVARLARMRRGRSAVQHRPRWPDRTHSLPHPARRVEARCTARADDLACRLRLGDATRARSVGPNAVAPPRSDPHHRHDGSSAGVTRKTTRGDRLMAPPLLELKSVSKAFGGLQCIVRLDLEVREGEIVSVIGPNGAGKTTLFNLVTGIYEPDRGDILLDGKSLVGLAPHKITNRGVARTFQTLRLFLNMSVKENVMAATYGGTRASLVESILRLPRPVARSASRTARRGEALVLRPAADGLPLEPACVQPLVREPSSARDRPRDCDEAAHPPPRRAGRRHEPRRDARDHGADRQAPGRGWLHDPRDRARHARRRGNLRPGRRAGSRREDRRGHVEEVATNPRVVEAYLGTSATERK